MTNLPSWPTPWWTADHLLSIVGAPGRGVRLIHGGPDGISRSMLLATTSFGNSDYDLQRDSSCFPREPSCQIGSTSIYRRSKAGDPERLHAIPMALAKTPRSTMQVDVRRASKEVMNDHMKRIQILEFTCACMCACIMHAPMDIFLSCLQHASQHMCLLEERREAHLQARIG